MTQGDKGTIRKISESSHKWPESIDMDKDGTLYFTDVGEKALYRMRYDSSSGRYLGEEKLINGLRHIAGISIDREKNNLYIGVIIKGDDVAPKKIIIIPLSIFETCSDIPYTPDRLQNECHIRGGAPYESFTIYDTPNGVVFDAEDNSAHYTVERLFGGILLGSKGYIGTVRSGSKKEVVSEEITPNGMDVCQSAGETEVVVSLFNKNSIMRFPVGKAAERYVKKLANKNGNAIAYGPDGLICLKGGDVLVAAFWSGKILYLAWNGSSYSDPVVLFDGLDNPTDLVLGPSSDGSGQSLYVTSTVLWRSGLPKSFAGGKIIELPDFDKKIDEARKALSKTGYGY